MEDKSPAEGGLATPGAAAPMGQPVILHTPLWSALRLDRHLSALKWSLVPYFVLLIVLWLQIIGAARMPRALLGAVGLAFGLLYLFMVGEAFFTQRVMNDAGVYKHGAWQILVGAMFLNPCALGWWMPVSVLLAARRVRTRLEEEEVKGQTAPLATKEVPTSRRPVVMSAPPTVLQRLFLAAALPIVGAIVSVPLQLLLHAASTGWGGVHPADSPHGVIWRILGLATVPVGLFGSGALLRVCSRAAAHYTRLRLTLAGCTGIVAALGSMWLLKTAVLAAGEGVSVLLFFTCAIAAGFIALGRPRDAEKPAKESGPAES
jgi:hypothetical protein